MLPAMQAESETVDQLLSRQDLKIERIVSTGQASPPGFWYDQPWDEWVIMLSGARGFGLKGKARRGYSLPATTYLFQRMSAIASIGQAKISQPSGWRSTSRLRERQGFAMIMDGSGS